MDKYSDITSCSRIVSLHLRYSALNIYHLWWLIRYLWFCWLYRRILSGKSLFAYHRYFEWDWRIYNNQYSEYRLISTVIYCLIDIYSIIFIFEADKWALYLFCFRILENSQWYNRKYSSIDIYCNNYRDNYRYIHSTTQSQ